MKNLSKLQKLSNLISESKSKYNNDFELIHEILERFDIEYCIIGGSALAEYNFFRATEDIDILVSIRDKEKLANIGIGYIRDISDSRGRRFKVHGMKQSYMEVIYSGEVLNPKALKFPEPSEVRIKVDGVWVISLEHLISTKLQAGLYGKGRELDIYDVRKLILNNRLKKSFMSNFRDDIKDKYIEIWMELKDDDDIFLKEVRT